MIDILCIAALAIAAVRSILLFQDAMMNDFNLRAKDMGYNGPPPKWAPRPKPPPAPPPKRYSIDGYVPVIRPPSSPSVVVAPPTSDGLVEAIAAGDYGEDARRRYVTDCEGCGHVSSVRVCGHCGRARR